MCIRDRYRCLICYWYLCGRLWNTSATCEWHCTGVWYVIGIHVTDYGTHPLPVSGAVEVFDMLLVFMLQAMEHIHYLWVGLCRCLICYWYLCDRLWNTSTTCEWRCTGVWCAILFMWQAMEHVHYLWVGPLQVAIVMFLLYREVGTAGLLCLVVMAAVVVLHTVLEVAASKLRSVAMTIRAEIRYECT